MGTVDAYEARTHFAGLLDRVESGERITITRRGRAVAHLVPLHGARDGWVGDVIANILDARSGQRLGSDLAVRDLINADRP